MFNIFTLKELITAFVAINRRIMLLLSLMALVMYHNVLFDATYSIALGTLCHAARKFISNSPQAAGVVAVMKNCHLFTADLRSFYIVFERTTKIYVLAVSLCDNRICFGRFP